MCEAFPLPVVIFALRLCGQGMTSHIAVVAMARWFDAERGRALSIAALGFSVGEAVLPIVFVVLLGFLDCRCSDPCWRSCAHSFTATRENTSVNDQC